MDKTNLSWRCMYNNPNRQKLIDGKVNFLLLVMLFLLLIPARSSFAQKKVEDRKMFLDTLDQYLDFSHFILDAHGFLPIAMIITEPALGHFGLAAGPVFIKPKEPAVPGHYEAPDLTLGTAMYTLNKSWMFGAGRIGSIPKAGIKYRLGTGYGDINLDFYRTILGTERKFEFSLRSFPVLLSISKKIGKTEVYLGIDYSFMKTRVTPQFSGELPDFISDLELDNQTAMLGAFIDWDLRDNIFTPDKGFRLNIEYGANAGWTGSDFDYKRLFGSFICFLPWQNIVSGFRLEVQHVFDDPPFYLLPGIDMRGMPAVRYQGQTTALIETEQRYDFNLRWSGIFFTGLGKAIEKNESFSEADLQYSVGGGFRYLLARVFKIRAGVDIAAGSGGFGYYIVFGQNWNR